MSEPRTGQQSTLLYRAGNVFFKLRGYTPIPLAAVLLWQAQVQWPWAVAGLVLIIAGELIRLQALRSSGKITRTRSVGARKLVTWGLYARSRNPLYIGNFLLWIGVVLFGGGAYQGWILAAMLLFFSVQYALIIHLEESRLAEIFGTEYDEYKSGVGRLFTLRSRWTKPGEPLHSWGYSFASEKSTLIAIAALILFSLVSTCFKG